MLRYSNEIMAWLGRSSELNIKTAGFNKNKLRLKYFYVLVFVFSFSPSPTPERHNCKINTLLMLFSVDFKGTQD
jgi:hypothetical protein